MLFWVVFDRARGQAEKPKHFSNESSQQASLGTVGAIRCSLCSFTLWDNVPCFVLQSGFFESTLSSLCRALSRVCSKMVQSSFWANNILVRLGQGIIPMLFSPQENLFLPLVHGKKGFLGFSMRTCVDWNLLSLVLWYVFFYVLLSFIECSYSFSLQFVSRIFLWLQSRIAIYTWLNMDNGQFTSFQNFFRIVCLAWKQDK